MTMSSMATTGAGRELRSDAAANRAKILAAARSTFDQLGFEVGMEVIAQRAGVGVGTIYRRFPTKELLIEAILDEVADAMRQVAIDARDHQPPAASLEIFLVAVGELQVEHAGVLPRLWGHIDQVRRSEFEELGREILERSQAAGAVRLDLVYEDVVTIFWSLRGVIERSAGASPDAWRRHLELVVAALGPSERPLRTPPMTASELRRAKQAARSASR